MATWYARTGNGSWNGSAWVTVTWNTAADGSGSNGTPATNDNLDCNTRTINFGGNYNLGTGTLSNKLSSGSFTMTTNGVTLTANIGDGVNTSSFVLSISGTGTTVTINGNMLGGAGGEAVHVAGTSCVVTANGSATGGTTSVSYALNNVSATSTAGVTTAIASTACSGINGNVATGTTTFKAATFASNGKNPTEGFCKMVRVIGSNLITATNSAGGNIIASADPVFGMLM